MRQPIRIFCCILQKICFLFFLSIVLSFQLYATDSTQVIHYTTKDGLPTNNIYSGIIGRQGYLWFATDQGVVRYNGYNFRVYNAGNAGLPDDDIYKIDEDNLGRIWLATLKNATGYLKNGHFIKPDIINKNTNRSFYLGDVACIGKITILKIISPAVYVVFVSEEGDKLFEIPDYNTYLYLTPKGKIFYIFGRDVYLIDLTSRKLFLHKISTLPFSWINELSERLQPVIYENGIAISKGNNNLCSITNLYSGTRQLLDINKYLNNEKVYTMPKESLAPTLITDKHIYTFDFNLNITKTESLTKPGFENTQVTYKIVDSSGDAWYTTNSAGLIKVLHNSQLLKHVSLRMPDNIRYMGKLNGRYSFWKDLKEYVFYQISSDGDVHKWQNKNNGDLRINSMFNYDDQTIGLIFRNEIALFNIYSGKQRAIFASREKVKVRDLSPESKDTNTYIGDVTRALVPKANFWRGTLTAVKYDQGKIISSSAIGVFLHDFNQDSVLATHIYKEQRYDNGFYSQTWQNCVLYNAKEIAVFNQNQNRFFLIQASRFLDINKINSLTEDNFGNIYLFSENQLMILSDKMLKRQVLSTRFNLVRAKLQVYKDNLVIAGKFGVAIAKILGKGKISPFYIAANTGNKLYENVDALWVNERNNIIIQTDNGFVQTNIDSVYAYGINQDKERTAKFSFALNFPYQQAIHQGDTINIDQKDQRLSLDAINFYGKGNVQYNYKINSSQWSQSATGEILLTSLKPNQYYKLQLTAKDDIWQSKTITAWVYVTPYWWQTSKWHIIFIVASAIILALSILGIISIIREAVIKANEKKRKLTDLELRAIHSQINPHFIFNTLSTALYFITRKDFDNAYNHVNKFSKLLRSYLKSSHDRFMLLSEEIEMLKRYIELQQTRFENRFDYKIHVENKVPAGDIQIPSLLLQPLVENAINHGLFHLKHRKGLLLINFEQGKNATELICTIEDNGVGRDAASTIKKESDADRQSYGSKLTEKLVEIFRQYEEMNIHIEYRDKPEPEKGTVVKLTISNVRYIGFDVKD